MGRPDPRVCFLVGFSRAGCTWLSRMLNQHPQIAVFGQSRFWGKHFVAPEDDGSYQPRQVDRIMEKIHAFTWNATIGHDPGCFPGMSLADFRSRLEQAVRSVPLPASPASVFGALARCVADIKAASWVVEKTPHHVLHARRILGAMPDARWVVLRCDAPSHMRALKSQPDLIYHPLAAAVVFRRYHAACDWIERNHRQRAMVVEYDRLRDDPVSELERIRHFLGCADHDWMRTTTAFYHGFEPNESLVALGPADRFWGRIVHGTPIMGRKGRSWSAASEVFRSVIALPPFVVRHTLNNLPEIEGSWWDYYRGWLRLDN